MADDPPVWAAELRGGDPDHHLTALFAPASRRPALWAVAAFHLEIARARRRVREPMMARIRLQWWRDGIAALYGEGEAAPHPLLVALGAAVAAHGLSRAPFEAALAAREDELDAPPPPTLAALAERAEALAAPLAWSQLEALGADTPAARQAACLTASALWLASGLANLPEDGAAVLPRDRLDALGVRLSGTAAARAGLPAVVAEVAAEAKGRLECARALKPQVPRAGIPALLPGVLAGLRLKTLARAGHDAYAAAVRVPHPFRPAALAWATVRGRYWL
jgi:NADH dehydrogenase [ubiquinone] 1 alpha subcomplex assembly factor 6